LCLLACAAAGGDWHLAVPAAAAVEILHNFSLVHDDIEDISPTRRGRATLWTLWGQAQAINTGDAMFAMSHLAIVRLLQRGLEPDVVVQALRRFDETCVELTRGQHIDMSFEARGTVPVADYVEMITGKTAVLVALCAELGALIAGADDECVQRYSQFGLNLGLAFQVQDDILGIWGDESLTGKSAATDIATRKKTLPVLFALAGSQEMRGLYDGNGSEAAFVRQATKLLNETGAQRYATEQAEWYSRQAMANLQAAQPVEPAATALVQLTDMLLQRRN
jgi:geranylgeranyl diphosphate synthase type I